jgi:hypothetical protein
MNKLSDFTEVVAALIGYQYSRKKSVHNRTRIPFFLLFKPIIRSSDDIVSRDTMHLDTGTYRYRYHITTGKHRARTYGHFLN